MLWRYLYLLEYSPIIMRIFFFILMVIGLPLLFVDIKKGGFFDFFVGQEVHEKLHNVSGVDSLENARFDSFFKGFSAPLLLITNKNIVDDNAMSNIDAIKKKGISIERILYASDYCAENNNMWDESLISNYAGGILIDLPAIGYGDSGSIICLCELMHEAARTAIPLFILDRPNLLSSKSVEGPFVSYRHKYDVVRLPMKTGMTVAEFAFYYNTRRLFGKAKIEAIPMYNYCRKKPQYFFETQYLCSILSHVEPFYVSCDEHFPLGCLMLSDSVVFAEKHWYQLQVKLRELGIDTLLDTHINKETKELYRGLKYCCKSSQEQINSFDVLVTIVTFFRSLEIPIAFKSSFDCIFDNPMVRYYLQGKVSKKRFSLFVNKELENFYRDVFGLFIYSPLPSLIFFT